MRSSWSSKCAGVAMHRSPRTPPTHYCTRCVPAALQVPSGLEFPVTVIHSSSACLRVASGVSSCNSVSQHIHCSIHIFQLCASTVEIATIIRRRDLMCTQTRTPAWSSMHVAKTDVVTKMGGAAVGRVPRGLQWTCPFRKLAGR